MNGKPGDHPVTDICVHGRSVFSPVADALVREIEQLCGSERLYELLDWFNPPAILDLERQLETIRDRLLAKAKADGWEVG
jgi:hypothetical protein